MCGIVFALTAVDYVVIALLHLVLAAHPENGINQAKQLLQVPRLKLVELLIMEFHKEKPQAEKIRQLE